MIVHSYEKYLEDVAVIKEQIEYLIMRGHVNINIVGINRGSLPIAVHLSNILPAKMSIINYQTRDGDCTEPMFVVDTIAEGDTIILLDDIYDSGKTIRDCKKMIEATHPEQHIQAMTQFGKENEDGCWYAHTHTGDWIEFHWETNVDF